MWVPEVMPCKRCPHRKDHWPSALSSTSKIPTTIPGKRQIECSFVYQAEDLPLAHRFLSFENPVMPRLSLFYVLQIYYF